MTKQTTLSTSNTPETNTNQTRKRVLDTNHEPPANLLTNCVKGNTVTITIRDETHSSFTIKGTVTGGQKYKEQPDTNTPERFEIHITETQPETTIETVTISLLLGSIIDVDSTMTLTHTDNTTQEKHIHSLDDVIVEQTPTLVVDMISGGGIKPSTEISFQPADTYSQRDWKRINVDGWWINNEYPNETYPASAYEDGTLVGKMVFYKRNNVEPEYEWFVDPVD